MCLFLTCVATTELAQRLSIKWRAKYGGMDAWLIKRMKELEAENQRLKKMYAESKMDADILKDSLAGKY